MQGEEGSAGVREYWSGGVGGAGPGVAERVWAQGEEGSAGVWEYWSVGVGGAGPGVAERVWFVFMYCRDCGIGDTEQPLSPAPGLLLKSGQLRGDHVLPP